MSQRIRDQWAYQRQGEILGTEQAILYELRIIREALLTLVSEEEQQRILDVVKDLP